MSRRRTHSIASTGSPCNKMSTLTKSAGCSLPRVVAHDLRAVTAYHSWRAPRPRGELAAILYVAAQSGVSYLFDDTITALGSGRAKNFVPAVQTDTDQNRLRITLGWASMRWSQRWPLRA
jgi:hypothetical protein